MQIRIVPCSCATKLPHVLLQKVLNTAWLDECCRRMDAHIKELKHKKDPNWKRLLVESFETTLSDPKVSSNVEIYVVPDSDPVESLR